MSTAPKDFNRTRAEFMRRASSPHVLPHAFKLAWLLAYRYMDRKTATAWPSQETLATDLGVSIRTVQRLLDILKPLGLTVVPGHGPNRVSTYWIHPEKGTPESPIAEAEKATPMSPINTTPVSPIADRIGDIQRPNRRHPATEKATPMSPKPIRRTKKKNQGEESDSRPPDSDSEKRDGRRKQKPARDLDASFAEFWEAYPSHKARETARKAYSAAVERGTEASVINAGAKVYALTERARIEAGGPGGHPRYTKLAHNWLNESRWTDPLPDGLVIDEAGNVVGFEQEQEQEDDGGIDLDEIAEIARKAGATY
jgi:hypothetical protein